MVQAAADPKTLLRLETLVFQGRPLAQFALLPVGQVDPEPLISGLDPRDQQRVASLKNPSRIAEYVLSRWLLQQLQVQGPSAVTHCRRWLCAVATPLESIGADVESRLPRRLPEVVERLGWQALEPAQYLQAWTLWESWRKLEGGSVLDAPDLGYELVLRAAPAVMDAPTAVAGVTWRSLQLEGAVLTIGVR